MTQDIRVIWSKLKSPSGADEQDLANCLDMHVHDIFQIPIKYTNFFIPKKRGRNRLIRSPHEELKSVQRLILKRLLERLPCHPSVMGFRKGYSIVTNARSHLGSKVILGVDIRDFFPSTRRKRIYTFFRGLGWNREAALALTRLCTFKDGLPQGAPTSPVLSNLVNYPMDCRLKKLALAFGTTIHDIAMTFVSALNLIRNGNLHTAASSSFAESLRIMIMTFKKIKLVLLQVITSSE